MNLQESKKIEKFVKDILKKYLPKNEPIIVGISGGADSVFLFEMLKDYQIVIAHVNHCLRAKESEKDQIFVAKLAKDHPFELLKKDIKAQSKLQKSGLEETGRKIRYEFFEKLAKKHHSNFILTAHHADDNAETIILNMARGAGLKGLSGMQEIEDYKKFKLLRPLLNINKQYIKNYLKLKKISFREDQSNNDKTYTRNFIRHEIIPLLKKINPNLTSTIAKNAKILRETNDFLEQKAQQWIDKNFKNHNFDAKKFRNLSPVIQKTVLTQIYKKLTNNTKNLEAKHFEEVLALINNNIGNKQKKFGKLLLEIKNNTVKVNVAK